VCVCVCVCVCVLGSRVGCADWLRSGHVIQMSPTQLCESTGSTSVKLNNRKSKIFEEQLFPY
jgi:hypothetical protein